MMNKGAVVALITLVMAAFGFTSGYAQTFSTPSGAVGSSGLPVDAEATFTLGDGTIELTIQNLEANPTSVAQNVSDLFFTVSDASGAWSTLASSASLVNVAADGPLPSAGSDVTTRLGADSVQRCGFPPERSWCCRYRAHDTWPTGWFWYLQRCQRLNRRK